MREKLSSALARGSFSLSGSPWVSIFFWVSGGALPWSSFLLFCPPPLPFPYRHSHPRLPFFSTLFLFSLPRFSYLSLQSVTVSVALSRPLSVSPLPYHDHLSRGHWLHIPFIALQVAVIYSTRKTEYDLLFKATLFSFSAAIF